jgi:uncharacterized protein
MELRDLKPAPLGDVPGSPENIRLQQFKPKSIFNTPHNFVPIARYPVIDMHAHAWDENTDISEWVKRMDAANIAKTIVLSFETGDKFDAIVDQYSGWGDRFSIWCGFDYTGYASENDWQDHAISELQRCNAKGAQGVGELGDKGTGEFYSSPIAGIGMHINDKRMDPLLDECAKLKMPVNFHVADPIWMYLPMDVYNDGMMNAYNWRIELKEGMLDHAQLLHSFEHALKKHPRTVFIACHLANCTHDLSITARLLDSHPNLYCDISSRLKEICTVPRYAAAFLEKYQDRLLFGSDVGYDPSKGLNYATQIYEVSFRLMETADEHVYEHDLFKYHWPLYGLELSDDVLKKLYYDNAKKLINDL